MEESYIPRTAEATLQQLAVQSPVVAVTGPRQSGKTTLTRHAFPELPYANLEDPESRMLATDDPRSFLKRLGNAAIIDEAQRVPALFSYLQVHVDALGRQARFVLSGSANFALAAQIGQSLAGRVAYLHLLPFAKQELETVKLVPNTVEELLCAGGYPPIYDRGANPVRWYSDYVATYLERGVRQLLQVASIDAFQRFLRLCAGWVGQLLNLTRIAADCGISANTAKAWLNVLCHSYIVHLLPPHHRNFRKRLVRTPKLYFLDTGLAARLLGIERADQLHAHPARGPLFENWVVSELLKARYNHALPDNLYFWRDNTGEEVDILVDRGSTLLPVECKSGATIASDWFRAISRWTSLAQGESAEPYLIYGGDSSLCHQGVQVLSWRDVTELEKAVERAGRRVD